jgi:membrane-bound lytic murein transglycosylase MltF
MELEDNKKKNTRLLAGVSLLLLLVIFAAFFLYDKSQQKIHDLPFILESGRLSVLTDSSSIGFSVKGDSVSGFQYEIVKAFADKLGVELVISEQNDLKLSIDGLITGDFNIVANFIPNTTQLKNQVMLTDPLFISRQVLVQRISSDSIAPKLIKKQHELANDSINIPANSPYKKRLENLSNEIASKINIFEIKGLSAEQMVNLVTTGKIKYTICEEQFAQKLKFKYPNIDISLPIGFAHKLSWAVHPKSPKLLKELNDFLNDFIGSSAYWDIYRKYY